MRSIAVIVLGAGGSSRFGGDKLVERLGDKPVIAHVVDAVLETHHSEIVVVTKSSDDPVVHVLPRSERVRVVSNPDHAEGMSTSLKCGLRSLPSSVHAAVVLLGDEPEITAGAIGAVVDAYRSSPARAVRASYGGRPGHPVVLGRELWPDLLLETGDRGAQRVLERADDVEVVEIGLPAPMDVDTQEDLVALRRRLSRM